jgi:hypothetical protein
MFVMMIWWLGVIEVSTMERECLSEIKDSRENMQGS